MKTINYNKFLQEAMKKARETDTPISGSIELTPLCNLDCKMCYVHLTDPTVKERMLSGDQWIGLIPMANNIRLYTSPPRDSDEWKAMYNKRISAERSNKRIKLDSLLELCKHRSTMLWYVRLYLVLMLLHLSHRAVPV